VGGLGVVIGTKSPGAEVVAKKLEEFAKEHNFFYYLFYDTRAFPDSKNRYDSSSSNITVIVTLGGDGTFLGAVRWSVPTNPVIVGVNFGKLGFLTEITPEEIIPTLRDFFRGTANVATRPRLVAFCERQGEEIYRNLSLNDIAILKGVDSPLPELEISVSGEEVMSFKADGVLVSTPTGSTAYSLSAGGAIVHPDLEALLITPVCPHSLTLRPILLPMAVKLQISVEHSIGELSLILDGHGRFSLLEGDIIRVANAENPVRYLPSPSRDYFQILRTKLNWGLPNRP
jgi:NAD+ kinase